MGFFTGCPYFCEGSVHYFLLFTLYFTCMNIIHVQTLYGPTAAKWHFLSCKKAKIRAFKGFTPKRSLKLCFKPAGGLPAPQRPPAGFY